SHFAKIEESARDSLFVPKLPCQCQALLVQRSRPPAVSLILGHHPQVVEDQRNRFLIAQGPVACQALCIQSGGPGVVILGECLYTQVVERKGNAAVISNLPVERERGVVERACLCVLALAPRQCPRPSQCPRPPHRRPGLGQCFLQPAASFLEVAAYLPEPPQRPGQPESHLSI